MGEYKIQYSHDNQRWFDFGADATREATRFSLKKAHEKFDYLLENYRGVFKWLRLVFLVNNAEIRKEKMSCPQFPIANEGR